MTEIIVSISLILAGTLGIIIVLAMWFRTVVSTNETHIVQSAKMTTHYGKSTDNGNAYYAWPSWIPVIGIERIEMPMSIFAIDLKDYEAYDNGRLPFVVDVKAFFRVAESIVAAERIESINELERQLHATLQGATRTILADHELEDIMQSRAKFGVRFTEEVDVQLRHWGVQTVKAIELMDLRDTKGSQVIANIMAKKKSQIEMESKVEVAENEKTARVAEIENIRIADVAEQDAKQIVGIRKADKEKAIGIAIEISEQDIKEQARITAEKDMEIRRVQDVKAAEIAKQVTITKSEEEKQETLITADADLYMKQKAADAKLITDTLAAEGSLNVYKADAEGQFLAGEAEAKAKQLSEMAVVTPQLALASEIGENEGYQKYLVEIRVVEKDETIGIEQAKALAASDLKIIANTGGINEGVESLTKSLASGSGGMSLGRLLENFKATETGAAVLAKLGV